MDIELCLEKIVAENKSGRARARAINGNIGAASPCTRNRKTPVPYASTLTASSPDEIEAECKEVIRAVEGSGLRTILGTNCWAPQGVPFVKLDTIVYAARKHGTLQPQA